MDTYISAQINHEDLETLVKKCRYGRYCEDPHLPLQSSRNLLLDRFRQQLSVDSLKHFTTYSASGLPLGIILFRLSEWDTQHFGYPFAIIDSLMTKPSDYERELDIVNKLLERFQVWCQSNSIRCVVVRLPSLDLPAIHSFEQQGFRFIESWIYNKYDLEKVDRLGEMPFQLRLACPDDYEFMLEYSKEAFNSQHFHADHHFDRDKADSLYRKWISTAFNDPNQKIAVLDGDVRPAAFMIYYHSDLQQYFGLKFIQWKMALLDPMSRGKGVGTNFFISLMHYHRQEGLDVVDSGLSMRNLPSLNLHNKLNFRVITTVITFHKWFT